MVVVKLIGGLGNQLFQYALGLQLAQRHQTVCKLDASAFENYKLHKYSLWPYALKEAFATEEELRNIGYARENPLKRALRRVVRRGGGAEFTVVRERSFRFAPAVLESPDNVYLDGYWQSEKYFSAIGAELRNQLTLKVPLGAMSEGLRTQLSQQNSVSIHIRRADYVTDAKTSSIHGICSLDYYSRAVDEIRNTLPDPVFYVFSDDHSWVKDNFTVDGPAFFVDHNDAASNYEDLFLMSSCCHQIIANSSFSWWGAWLNPNPEKIVIAPRQWFNDPTRDTRDLLPPGWCQL